MRGLRDRAVKEALLSQIMNSGKIDIRMMVEWLWEDFGLRVRRDWNVVKRAVLRSPDVSAQDLAVFMIENGVVPDEGAWDARPTVRMRGGIGDSKDNR